jgi:peroxiredoxin
MSGDFRETDPFLSGESMANREANGGLVGPGQAAPDFSLPSGPDKRISLKELRGRPVVLAFYPADWSPVCGDQMTLYNEVLAEFSK